MHFPECLTLTKQRPGAILKIEFGTVDSNEMTTIEAASEKKHGWLPILVVLFLISYGLMTMLIVEQGRTIESQRALIHELFKDSTELSAVKTKAEDERAQTAQSQATVARNPSSQNPSTEMQSKRTPSTQAPLTAGFTKAEPVVPGRCSEHRAEPGSKAEVAGPDADQAGVGHRR